MLAARFLLFARRPGAVQWRLISANNRTLARAARAEPDVDAALRVIATLQESAASAPARVLADGVGGWRWTLTASRDAVAVGARSYLRRIECDMALASFRESAGGALVRPELMRQRSGPRPPTEEAEAPAATRSGGIPGARSGGHDAHRWLTSHSR